MFLLKYPRLNLAKTGLNPQNSGNILVRGFIASVIGACLPLQALGRGPPPVRDAAHLARPLGSKDARPAARPSLRDEAGVICG